MFILGAGPVIVSTYADSFELNRSSFPEGFVFGTGSSNYQVRFVTLCMLLCMWKYAQSLCMLLLFVTVVHQKKYV